MFATLICGHNRPFFVPVPGGFGKVGGFKYETIRKDILN